MKTKEQPENHWLLFCVLRTRCSEITKQRKLNSIAGGTPKRLLTLAIIKLCHKLKKTVPMAGTVFPLSLYYCIK